MVESKKTKLSSGKKSFNQHKINIIFFNEEKTLKRTKKNLYQDENTAGVSLAMGLNQL